MIDFMKDGSGKTISPVSITALKPFDGKTVAIYLNGGMLFRSGQLNLSKAKFRVGLDMDTLDKSHIRIRLEVIEKVVVID